MITGRGLLTRKHADEVPRPSYALAGRLIKSKSGWLLLEVPNSLLRGCFDALDEPGIELPYHEDGSLNAHISVMRPEELEQIGGAETVTERGHMFHYTLGPLKTVTPSGWEEMSKVWMIQVKSPELERLRKSYGLSNLPNEGKFEFHITIAVRKKNVLNPGEVRKAAAAATFKEHKYYEPICPHCNEEMGEKSYWPEYDKETNTLSGKYRHRGPCYDKGAFDIDWPQTKAASIKAAEMVSTRTATRDGIEYDIDQLLQRLFGREAQEAPLPEISRSRREGFSQNRYDSADLGYPIVLDQEGRLWDGRHRVAKARDQGLATLPAVTATDEDLTAVRKAAELTDETSWDEFNDWVEKVSDPFYQRAMLAQLDQPSVDFDQGLLFNLGTNLRQARERGQQMVREQDNDRQLESSARGDFGMQQMQDFLEHGDPVQDPLDQLLFRSHVS